MPWRCTELSKLTSPSLWNLTVDLAARFSQTFFTRASFHRGEEVWLKSFNFQSFFALKIIILYFKTQLSAWNRSIFFLQDLSSRFELAYSALDSVKPAALVGNTVGDSNTRSLKLPYRQRNRQMSFHFDLPIRPFLRKLHLQTIVSIILWGSQIQTWHFKRYIH